MLSRFVLFEFFTGASEVSASGAMGGSLPLYALFDGFSPSGAAPAGTTQVLTFDGPMVRILTEKQAKRRRQDTDYILLLLS